MMRRMSKLMAAIYDRMMAGTEEACLAAWRAEVLAVAQGDVLEVGAGTGANLRHYPQAVERLRLAEPDPDMRRLLSSEAAKWTGMQVEVVDHTMEQLPYPSAVFDTVVCTLVLCSVSDPPRAVREAYRVLKPGGSLVFIEHVAAATGTSLRVWQGRIEPLWHRLAGNCHLTRMTERTIGEAGFSMVSIQRQSLRKALPFVRPSIRGVAEKRA